MIPISRASEYAIRAMTQMARLPDDRFVLARDLARDLDIPAPFLGKVLQQMVARGMLVSQRGRNGGFKLAHPPGSISLYEVVDSQEHLGRARQCFLGQAECTDERACPLHEFWKGTANAFQQRLVGTTLADLVGFCEAQPESGYPLPLPD